MATPADLAVLAQSAQVVSGVIDSLRAIPDAVRKFTDAINPQAGLNLDRAFRSLYATIGHAMLPIIETATRTVDRFAGALMGAMDRLRGPVEKVAHLFERAFAPVLQSVSVVGDSLAGIIESLEPVFRLLGGWLEGAAAQMAVLINVVVALQEAMTKATLSGFGDLSKTLFVVQDQFVNLSVAVLQATAHFLLLIGATDVLRRILKGVMGQPPGLGRTPAPLGVQIGGLEDIYRRRLVEAGKGMAGASVEEKQLTAQQRIAAACEGMLQKLEKEPDAFRRELSRSPGGRAAESAGALLTILERLFGRDRQNQRNQP